jgi:hypothetical protein
MNEEHTDRVDPKRYEMVGWLSITSAVLLFPSMLLGIILEVGSGPVVLALLIPYVLLFSLSIGMSLYALYRFKGLLNDRYQFHDVDNLITAIVILGSVFSVAAISARVVGTFLGINVQDPNILIPVAIGGAVFFALVGLPLSILSIIFAVKLLRLRDDLGGLIKPYAWTTIVASAMFATFILAFLGFFLDAVCSVMLGLIFLRASRGVPHPEFV